MCRVWSGTCETGQLLITDQPGTSHALKGSTVRWHRHLRVSRYRVDHEIAEHRPWHGGPFLACTSGHWRSQLACKRPAVLSVSVAKLLLRRWCWACSWCGRISGPGLSVALCGRGYDEWDRQSSGNVSACGSHSCAASLPRHIRAHVRWSI
jgi:hypothetical protein